MLAGVTKRHEVRDAAQDEQRMPYGGVTILEHPGQHVSTLGSATRPDTWCRTGARLVTWVRVYLGYAADASSGLGISPTGSGTGALPAPVPQRDDGCQNRGAGEGSGSGEREAIRAQQGLTAQGLPGQQPEEAGVRGRG